MAKGIQTTEFWGTVPGAAALVETAQSMSNPWVQGVAIVGAVALIGWYTWSRTMVKAGAE